MTTRSMSKKYQDKGIIFAEVELSLGKAHQYIKQKKLGKALHHLNYAIRLDSKNILVLKERFRVNWELNNYKEAEEDAQFLKSHGNSTERNLWSERWEAVCGFLKVNHIKNGKMTIVQALSLFNLEYCSNENQLKNAFKKLMKTYHPDKQYGRDHVWLDYCSHFTKLVILGRTTLETALTSTTSNRKRTGPKDSTKNSRKDQPTKSSTKGDSQSRTSVKLQRKFDHNASKGDLGAFKNYRAYNDAMRSYLLS